MCPLPVARSHQPCGVQNPDRASADVIAALEVRERKPSAMSEELIDQVSLDAREVGLLAPSEREVLGTPELPQ